jgi:iron complex outermembrane receptor protein
LPIVGSVKPNPNGAIPRDRFTGEPGQDPYRGYQSRVGYALTHRFDNGWTVNQNVRWQTFTLNGQLVANGQLRADNQTLRRTATDQHWDGDTITLDTNAQRKFATGFGRHEITLGLDYLRTRENSLSYNCSVRDLNVYQPVYGSPINCPANPRTDSSSSARSGCMPATRSLWERNGTRSSACAMTPQPPTRPTIAPNRERTAATTPSRDQAH